MAAFKYIGTRGALEGVKIPSCLPGNRRHEFSSTALSGGIVTVPDADWRAVAAMEQARDPLDGTPLYERVST